MMPDVEILAASLLPRTGPAPDPYGQAALILIESVLHALIESSVLSVDQAIGTVSTACAVKREFAEQSGEPTGCMQQSLDLLEKIAASLATVAS